MKQRKVEKPLLRYLLSLSSGIIVFLLVGFDGIVSVPVGTFGTQAATQKPKKSEAVPKNSVEPVYSVVSPLGDSTMKKVTMVTRLDTLAGKTVCMVWNHAFKADITFPAIEESLRNQYPNVKIVPYMEIDAAIRAAGGKIASTEPGILQAVFKGKGCNAVISGNGG